MTLADANILSVINYERNHKYRISTNYYVDSLATKKCFDYFTEALKNISKNNDQQQASKQGLVGFLQEINLVPYGLVFLCDQQV